MLNLIDYLPNLFYFIYVTHNCPSILKIVKKDVLLINKQTDLKRQIFKE